MTHEKLPPEDEALLEAHFDAVRSDTPEPSADLMARILADGEAEQAGFAAAAAPVPEAGTSRLWKALASFGGMPGVAGMATAVVAGLWVGLNPPVAVDSLAEAVFGAAVSELEGESFLPSLGEDLLEDAG